MLKYREQTAVAEREVGSFAEMSTMWALPEGVRCVSLGAEVGEIGDLGVDFAGKQSVEDNMRALIGPTTWLYVPVARTGDSIEYGFGCLFPAW